MATTFYQTGGKRILDLAVSTVGLAVLMPLMALIAAAIRREDGGPSLFRQERSGADGQTFTIMKFRSMPVATKELASAFAGDIEPTRIGRLIRRLNFDELPQLMNVLRGEMSIVGPRPALLSQLDLLELRWQGAATSIKPGLTGLAQIYAYDGMTELEKAVFDIRYAQNLTLREDLRILVATLGYLTKPPPIY